MGHRHVSRFFPGYIHTINDNEHWYGASNGAPGAPRPTRRAWRQGRLWWHADHESTIATLHAQWKIPAKWCFASITVNDEEYPLELRLGLGCYLYLGCGRWARKLPLIRRTPDTWHGERVIELMLHQNGFSWNLWLHPYDWSSSDPKWRRGTFNPLTALLGAYHHRVDVHATETHVAIPISEDETYYATIRLETHTWYRPNWPFFTGWPFTKRQQRADIEIDDEHGIPIPGKGENSWDCGDNATYSLLCSARTIPEAVGQMVASVLESRRRHGGPNWHPRALEEA